MREPRDFIGPSGEVTADILINGHDVPIKLPSKEPCLCLQVSDVATSGTDVSLCRGQL